MTFASNTSAAAIYGKGDKGSFMKEFFETERNFGNLDAVGLIFFYRTKNFFTAALLHSRSDHTILNHIMKNISVFYCLIEASSLQLEELGKYLTDRWLRKEYR